jgi:hypothetical protein
MDVLGKLRYILKSSPAAPKLDARKGCAQFRHYEDQCGSQEKMQYGCGASRKPRLWQNGLFMFC